MEKNETRTPPYTTQKKSIPSDCRSKDKRVTLEFQDDNMREYYYDLGAMKIT